MINIVVTSQPVDGLLYYSYEYCSYLNEMGVDARVVIICHRNFSKVEYAKSIANKYVHFKNVMFDTVDYNEDDVTLILGRSMMTLSWIDYNSYQPEQQESLKKLFGGNVISVYSENHPTKYPLALEFYNPKKEDVENNSFWKNRKYFFEDVPEKRGFNPHNIITGVPTLFSEN